MKHARFVGTLLAILCVYFIWKQDTDGLTRSSLILLLALAVLLIKPGSFWKTCLYALALVGVAGISILFIS